MDPEAARESAVAETTAGDVVATLVENHRQFLRFVEKRVSSRAAAEDILQAAFVKGIERRQRHINCPGWVGLFRWLKPILSTRVGLPLLLKGADQRLAQMDAETAGRHLNARIAELDGR